MRRTAFGLMAATLLLLPDFSVGGGRDRHLFEGRRADLLQELRRVSPADDVRADVARHLRRRAAVGAIDQAERVVARQMPPWGADPAHGDVQERPAPSRTGDRRPSWRGSTAARQAATTRICRRCRSSSTAGRSASLTRSSTMDEDVRDSGDRHDRLSSTSACRPDLTEDKWIQAIEIKPGARAHVHHVIAFTQPAGSADQSRPARSGRPTSAASRRTSRASCSSRASAPCCAATQDIVLQMHYTTNGTEATDRTTVGIIYAEASRRRSSQRGGMALNPRFVIPAGDGNARSARATQAIAAGRHDASRRSRRTCTCAART